jgi:hypothetical protein
MRVKLLRAVLALCGALLVTDGLVSLLVIDEGLFLDRPLPPFGALTHPKQAAQLVKMRAEPRGTWAFDAELGWTWRTSARSEDGLYVTNALGARGPREYGPQPAPGRRRVLTFGDSFVHCDEVAADETFQAQLEALEPDIEVLNFGVSGYGSDQAWLRYRRVGPGLGAEVVCLGLMLENIGRNVNRYRPLWNTQTGACLTKPRFVLAEGGGLELLPQPYATRDELREAIDDGSVLTRVREHEYWLGRPRVPTGRLSSLVRLAAGYLAYRERAPERLWTRPEAEPFRVTLEILEGFQREALADGARLAPILVFPAKEDLREHALRGRPYWGALFAELEQCGLDHLDLIEPLTRAAREGGEDPPGRSLYVDGHLSAKGNALVARELAAWLRAHPP